MAKKKPARRAKATAGRKPARAGSRKGGRVAKRVTKPTAIRPPVNAGPSLGRPKVTGEEDLDMLFKEDYHARQIFKFLRVGTVKDLEGYSAGEILRVLSRPIKETVERIRRLLAERNRCLAGDQDFALEHKENAKDALPGR
jgi:hypothetical protein